jgi:hypothetical protein
MPFNGSGVFQRVRNWVADATAGIKIRADYHDLEDDGFAAGLTNCITKDGQTIVTQNIPWNSKRITGLQDPVNPQDAATKAYTDTATTALGNNKVDRAGDTMTGALTVNATVTAYGYHTRTGLNGTTGGNWSNISWDGSPTLWIDDYNFGVLVSKAYVDGQDTSLQNQINTKGPNLGFTPVQQGGGTGMAGNKLYLGWDGSGIRFQVDNNDTMGYLLRGANAGGAIDARLAFAGDISGATGPQSSPYEPYAGATVTGWQWAIIATAQITAFRLRYLQIRTTSWYTVGYT